MKIGLEIHMQLRTNAKLFCECDANYRDAPPNTRICEICTGQPGAKPMAINSRAVENIIRIARAFGCEVVNGPILIQRKHYFYPDLPSGYQRTSKPIGTHGRLGDVRIREVHLEEDPGRYELRKGYVDYNRSGVPLIEMVTEPDIKSPEHAREFLNEVSAIIDYLEAVRDEPGSMRIDANISLEGGSRVEIKNINSFKGVYTALKYESVRQQRQLDAGKTVVQETRHFDEAQGITISLRKKETEADYRYIPDPDILPFTIEPSLVASCEATLPELPRAKMERFQKTYAITEEEAWVIVSEKKMADAYESMAQKFDPKFLANWMRTVLKKQLNYRNITYATSRLREDRVLELLTAYRNKEITEKTAEQWLIEMLDKNPDLSARALLESHRRIADEQSLEKVVDEVIAAYPKAVEDYRKGSEKSIHFLSGMVMKKTQGRAEARIVVEILRKKIRQE